MKTLTTCLPTLCSILAWKGPYVSLSCCCIDDVHAHGILWTSMSCRLWRPVPWVCAVFVYKHHLCGFLPSLASINVVQLPHLPLAVPPEDHVGPLWLIDGRAAYLAWWLEWGNGALITKWGTLSAVGEMALLVAATSQHRPLFTARATPASKISYCNNLDKKKILVL